MNPTGIAVRRAVVGAVFCMTVLLAQAQPVKLCYEDADLFPWLIKGGKGSHVILLEAAANRSGIPVEMVAHSWKRCLTELRQGTVDGAFQASYSDERGTWAVYPTRHNQLDVSRRLNMGSYFLYRRTGDPVGWDGSQFFHLTGAIGAQFGYSIVDDLKKRGLPVVDRSKSAEANVRNLLAGQLQAVAMLSQEGDYVVRQPEFAGKVEKVHPALAEKPYFLIFSKDFFNQHPKKAEALWDAIAVVRDSADFRAKEAAIKKKPGDAQ